MSEIVIKTFVLSAVGTVIKKTYNTVTVYKLLFKSITKSMISSYKADSGTCSNPKIIDTHC